MIELNSGGRTSPSSHLEAKPGRQTQTDVLSKFLDSLPPCVSVRRKQEVFLFSHWSSSCYWIFITADILPLVATSTSTTHLPVLTACTVGLLHFFFVSERHSFILPQCDALMLAGLHSKMLWSLFRGKVKSYLDPSQVTTSKLLLICLISLRELQQFQSEVFVAFLDLVARR